MKASEIITTFVIAASSISIGCNWLDNHNDIEYPVNLRMVQRLGEPVSLWFYMYFSDQTVSEDGVVYNWSFEGDTLFFYFEEEEATVDWNDLYNNTRNAELGNLEPGEYVLIFEGVDINQNTTNLYSDTLIFEVTDSVYRLQEFEGSAVSTNLDEYESRYWSLELRRLFSDMLVVEIALKDTNSSYDDSLRLELTTLGAHPCTVSSGDYKLFKVREDGFLYVPLSNGCLVGGKPELYSFSGDSIYLVNLCESYQEKLDGVFMRMGNGLWAGFGPMVIE